MKSTNELFGSIDDFIASVGQQKVAGDSVGVSTHPTADPSLDKGRKPATEGSRSAENSADVKEDQPVSIEHAADGSPGGQESTNSNIGLSQAATGEDPSVERDYKMTKDDPGTSHPAKAGTTKVGTDKYAGVPYDGLLKLATDLGEQLCATAGQLLKAPAPAAAPAGSKQASEAKPEQQDYAVIKAAADDHAVRTTYNALLHGHTLAIKVAEHLDELGAQEAAGGDSADAEVDPSMAAAPEAEGGGVPADAGAGGPITDLSQLGSPEEVLQLINALLAGQSMGGEEAAEQMSGGLPMEGGGGMPPEGGMPMDGGMPMEGGGEMPPEGALPPGGQEDAAMLGDILQGQGKTAESLEAAAKVSFDPSFKSAVKTACDQNKGKPYVCRSKEATEKYAKMRNYVTEVFTRSQS